MIFVKMNEKNTLPIEVDDYDFSSARRDHSGKEWKCRRDWKSLEEVEGLARYISAMTGKHYIGTDNGEWCSPRFDICQVPAIGDKVSYTFNGDSYPDGVITHITKTLQITTSTGNKYLRRKKSGCWKRTGGTWSLISGHHNERNPSF